MITLVNVFVIIATILFGFLFTIWSKKNFVNFLVKFVFFVMTIYGTVIVVTTFL